MLLALFHHVSVKNPVLESLPSLIDPHFSTSLLFIGLFSVFTAWRIIVIHPRIASGSLVAGIPRRGRQDNEGFQKW